MRTRAIAIAAAALYLVMFGLGAFRALGDRLILFPTRAPLDAGGAIPRILASPTGPLEVLVARAGSAAPRTYVLRFYGNADRPERWVAGEAAAWPGIEFWGVNYPGYGASAGSASLRNVATGALAAYDALAREANGRPIFVFGTSLGTTAALHVAAERQVAGLLLQNPPAPRQIVLQDQGWWNLWLLAVPVALGLPDGLDSLANARRVRAPAVFVLAENDDVVRPRYQRLIVEAYAGEKTVVVQPGARHNTPLDPQTARRVREALGRMMGE